MDTVGNALSAKGSFWPMMRAGRERAGGVSRERAFEHVRGTRTAPRAGRRGTSAHRFDERSEELARSPAARAAKPLRVARAQSEPRDAPPARGSRGLT